MMMEFDKGRDELAKGTNSRKLQKKKTSDQIVEELEESVEVIEKIIKRNAIVHC